jgi:hypothetical protein
MRSLVRLFALAAVSAYGVSSGLAQTTLDDARDARKNLDDCFFGSISGQISTGPKTEMNAMAEQAFLACATEEQAIISLLSINGIPAPRIANEVLKIKAALKKSARIIAANPEKYAK